MPLDAAGRESSVVLDPLVKLGITPIPEDVVARHKAEYTEAFFCANPSRRGLSRMFRWETIYWHASDRVITSDLCPTGYHGYERHETLKTWLAKPIYGLGNTDDHSGAPSEIVELAERVHREIPDTTFQLDYFERDPVLYAVYPFDGGKRKACLGIWDKVPGSGGFDTGKTVAIADH